MTYGLLAAAASPATLVLVTDYGQEGIFRVALFALPWLALLAARQDLPQSLDRIRGSAALAAVVAVLTVVNVLGMTGMDWARVVRPDSATATRTFERTAPDGAVLLSLGTGSSIPSSITERYLDVSYGLRGAYQQEPPAVGAAYDPVRDLEALTASFVAATPGQAHYALASESSGAYDSRYGLQRYADFLRLREAIARSPLWAPVYTGPTSALYRLAAEAPLGAPEEER
jgi:hypothetical protein